MMALAQDSQFLPPQPRKREKKFGETLLFLLILIGYTLFFFAFLKGFRVGLDNPGYTEPAANYVLGKGFTSASWYAQGEDAFWAGNVPLHQFLLIPWLKAFGISYKSVLVLNFLYYCLALSLVWLALKRSEFVRGAGWRLGAVMGLLMAGSSWVLLAKGRYDCLPLVLVSLATFCLTVRPFHFRMAGLFAAGFLLPWSHLPTAVYSGVAGILILAFYGKTYWKEIFCFALGGVAGALGLVIFLKSMGVWDGFVLSVAPHIQSHKAEHNYGVRFSEDHWRPGFDFALLCAGILFFTVQAFLKKHSPKFCLFVIANLALIPVAFLLTGKFSPFYGWCMVFPTTLFLFSLLSKQQSLARWSHFVPLAMLILFFCLPGNYFRKTFKDHFKNQREGETQEKYGEFARAVTRPDDIVWVDAQLYYPLKKNVKKVISLPAGFSMFNAIPQIRYPGEAELMDSVTVCIWDNTELNQAHLGWLPGQWKSTGQKFETPTTTLWVYRRTDR